MANKLAIAIELDELQRLAKEFTREFSSDMQRQLLLSQFIEWLRKRVRNGEETQTSLRDAS